ncbi:nuclear transport factor 2 family protein [Shewanella sp. TC10]|uniref:nuclear transport factor 2 family protein n=1 Tax=Shewanella sp. TC10 TaxID=1419739 RepID=UPI001E3E23FF|nr:nuclear transport factor 2 family protein [Shewanella sp. TC10]
MKWNFLTHMPKLRGSLQVLLALSLLIVTPFQVLAEDKSTAVEIDYETFTQDYFEAWKGSQKPDATKEDLEHYLSFLTDDIGYQHLPWSDDDSRQPDGKAALRKGMTYYLASHDEYSAELTNQAYGHNVIMIEFHTVAKGVHPDNGQVTHHDNSSFEVLEIDDGKVSVIRHYSK